MFNVAIFKNDPPGLTPSHLVEKYAWVDERLAEMYNSYALTADNCDEYDAAGLFREKYAWVDERLAEMYYSYALTADNCDEYDATGLLREKYAWVDERLAEMCAVTNDESRFIKRLRCQSPIPTGKYIHTSLSIQSPADSMEEDIMEQHCQSLE